jgi:hypothetical protein
VFLLRLLRFSMAVQEQLASVASALKGKAFDSLSNVLTFSLFNHDT